MSIAAGILLQAVASTGAVQAGPAEDLPSAVSPEGPPSEPAADAPPDDDRQHDSMGALPTVDVGNADAAPNALPRGVPEEEEPEIPPDERERVTARGGGAQPGGDWEFEFHGYFRAPFRLGTGERANAAPGQSDTSVHYPVVPDDQYFGYGYTLHNPRDWAELYFSYGNKIATGTVSIQGFNFTDAAWVESDMQFGIAQAFVTLTPKFQNKNFDLRWKLGSFDNRYGEAGRYDAGEFETYLFGRTHGTGEAGRIEIGLGKPDRWGRTRHRLGLEHGLAVNRPNPSQANAHRFTFLHHWHIDYNWDNKVEIGLHYLNAFAREADRAGEMANPRAPDGAIHVVGPDIRFDWGRIGYLYAGFSYIKLDNASVVGPAIEVLHSRGGGSNVFGVTGGFPSNAFLGTNPGPFAFGLVDNYLEYDNGAAEGSGTERRSNGNGSIMTFMGQLEHSVKRAMYGNKWDGESWNLAAKVYAMYNLVQTDDEDAGGSVGRLKVGFDLVGTPLKWLGAAFRLTRVQPHSGIPEQSFMVLSPRLIFRTDWISRETIEIQYSRYVYNQRVCPGTNNVNPETGVAVSPDAGTYDTRLCVQPPTFPAGPEGYGAVGNGIRGQPLVAPDENVFMIKATFWW